MRDPRAEPRPGDVLRKGKYQRHISRVDGSISTAWVYYGRKIVETPSVNYWNSCTLAGWRRWAKNAEVVSGGEAA